LRQSSRRGNIYGADEPRASVKVENLDYSPAVDRHELLER
jgi:hypothetical protein